MKSFDGIKSFTAAYCDIVLCSVFLRLKDIAGNTYVSTEETLRLALETEPGRRAVFVYLAAAAVIYLINTLFFWRDRSVASAAVLNVIIGVPEYAVLFNAFNPADSVWSVLIFTCIVILIHSRIVMRFFEPVSPDGLIRFLDGSVFSFILLLLYGSVRTVPGDTYIFVLTAVCLVMAALVSSRLENAETAGNAQDIKNAGIIALALAFIVIAVIIVLALTSDYLSIGTAAAVGFAGTAVKALGRACAAVINWIIALFPAYEADYELEIEETPVINLSLEDEPDIELSVPPALIAVGAAVLAAAVIWLLINLNKIKLNGRREEKKKTDVTRPGFNPAELIKSLWMALIDAMNTLKAKIIYTVTVISRRDTATGLAVIAEHSLRKSAYAKEASETYSAFLRRLAEAAKAMYWDNSEVAANACSYQADADASGTWQSEPDAVYYAMMHAAERFDSWHYGRAAAKIKADSVHAKEEIIPEAAGIRKCIRRLKNIRTSL